MTWELREKMNLTSDHFRRGVDEAEKAGLEMVASQLVKPMRVKDSPIHLECTYVKTVELLANVPKANVSNPYSLILGKVVGVHIRDDVLTDGQVDVAKVKPLARLGYQDYTVVENSFTIPFPDYPNDEAPEG